MEIDSLCPIHMDICIPGMLMFDVRAKRCSDATCNRRGLAVEHPSRHHRLNHSVRDSDALKDRSTVYLLTYTTVDAHGVGETGVVCGSHDETGSNVRVERGC